MNANLQSVLERIKSAAEKSGRSASSVQLIAITKYVDSDAARQLVLDGCWRLGESRPQDLWQKAQRLSDLNIQWHLVGHLQRNKVKRTIDVAELIHSVDSPRLLMAIDEAARGRSRTVDVLLEINISGESAKHGLAADQLPGLLDLAAGLANIRVSGLMCMAALGAAEDQTRRQFARLRRLKEQFADRNSQNIQLKELSMGMSGDFEAAIAEGATMVRIGSLLFQD
jgi:pyridoxal phosphate enzyme (YggS family)